MISMIWFWVRCTRFLWPPLKGDNCGCYHIIGDSLIHNSQNTILTLGTTSSMVKIVKQKHKVCNIPFQCLDILASFVFIKLFYYSSTNNLTPFLSLIKSPKIVPQSGAPVTTTLHPNWEYFVFCFLPLCHGIVKTYLQQVAKFGLWQNTSSKSPILANCFQWGCLVQITTTTSDCSQAFIDARHG
jgi:hypothetical protein